MGTSSPLRPGGPSARSTAKAGACVTHGASATRSCHAPPRPGARVARRFCLSSLPACLASPLLGPTWEHGGAAMAPGRDEGAQDKNVKEQGGRPRHTVGPGPAEGCRRAKISGLFQPHLVRSLFTESDGGRWTGLRGHGLRSSGQSGTAPGPGPEAKPQRHGRGCGVAPPGCVRGRAEENLSRARQGVDRMTGMAVRVVL